MSAHQINSHIGGVKIRRAREEDLPEINRLVLDGLQELRFVYWREMVLPHPACQVLLVDCVCGLFGLRVLLLVSYCCRLFWL